MGPWRYLGRGLPEVWVAGHIPWPYTVAEEGSLAPLPLPREQNLAPPGQLYDPSNLMAGQNRVMAAQWRVTKGRGVPVRDGLDVPVRRGGRGRRFTYRERFAALRAQGVRPHTMDPSWDGAVSALLVNFAQTMQELRRPWADATSTDTEEVVSPDLGLGLAQVTCTRVYPTTPEDERDGGADTAAWVPVGGTTSDGTPGTFQSSNIDNFGSFEQALGDLAAMGAGRIRRVQTCDLYWGALFPLDERVGTFYEYGKTVPPPGELLSWIQRDSYAALGATALLLEAATLAGVRVDLTLFNAGGGATLNFAGGGADADDPIAADYPTTLKGGKGWSPRWRDIRVQAPAWQEGSMAPSAGTADAPYGWDPFYWDDTAWPAKEQASIEALRTYQKFVVNVWPTAQNEFDPSVVTVEPYSIRCARRKGLALAAYSTGIGEWLAALSRAWSKSGGDLSTVVEYLEVGNEISMFWALSDSSGASWSVLDGYGAAEAGRFITMLTGPIAERCPWVKFRTEIASWQAILDETGEYHDEFAGRTQWLRKVLGGGVLQTLNWFQRLVVTELIRLPTSLPLPWDVEQWLDDCAEAGLYYPTQVEAGPVIPTPGQLMHAVGFHFFHGYNRNAAGEPVYYLYAGSERLAADIDRFTTDVIDALSPAYSLRTIVGAFLFPAVDPGEPTSENWSYYYDTTNQRFQAAMVLRYLLVMHAKGVDFAGVFTHVSRPAPNFGDWDAPVLEGWNEFLTDGVRYDLGAALGAYTHGQDDWPRPLWYTLRRYVWLMARGVVPTLTLDTGLTILHFDFSGAPLTTGPDGTSLGGSWEHLYIAWVDQHADDPRYQYGVETAVDTYLYFEAEAGEPEYRLLPVVPDVTPVATFRTPGTDGNGFALPEEVAWDWSGWTAAAPSLPDSGGANWGGTAIEVYLVKADPTTTPAPIAILTNGTLAEYTRGAPRKSPPTRWRGR